MKVIVPVAGFGKRLRPHTHSAPKPLLQVAGKPILAHVLDPVVPLQPEEVIFVVGYMGERIKDYVREHYSFKSTFVNQTDLLGLGYAINMAMEHVTDEPLLIILGDTIVQMHLGEFVKAGDYVLGVRKVDDPRRFGIAVVENDRVVNLQEKPEDPKSDLALIGVYYFENSADFKKALAAHVKSGKTVRGEIQLTDALEALIQQGHSFVPFEVHAWYDCGKKETMLDTNRHLLEQMSGPSHATNSKIVEPVYLGEDVELEDSTVGPHVSIADGSVVRHSTLVNTIVGRKAVLEETDLRDSLIGNEATIRGGRGQMNIGDHCEIDLL